MTVPASKILPQINLKAAPCKHSASEAASGIALIALGNELRGDDGIAQLVCRSIDNKMLDHVCYFDIGTASVYLGNCLLKHQSAVIVDAVESENPSQNSLILNLKEVLLANNVMDLSSSHGISFIDELKLFYKNTQPKSLSFFGIFCDKQNWQHAISHHMQNKLLQLKIELESHLTEVIEEQQ